MPALTTCGFNGSHQFQIQFTGDPSTSYTVLSATDLDLPLVDWQQIGTATEASPGQYQFTDTTSPAGPRRFYRVHSP